MPESDVVSLWDIDGKLEIKVDSAGNLNVGKDTAVSFITHKHFYVNSSSASASFGFNIPVRCLHYTFTM